MATFLTSLEDMTFWLFRIRARSWFLAYVVGGWVAWRLVRRPPFEPSFLGIAGGDDVSLDDYAVRVGWWVVLAGLIAAGINHAVTLAMQVLLMVETGLYALGTYDGVAVDPTVWIPIVMSLGVMLLTIAALRRLDWDRLRGATGYRLNAPEKLLLLLVGFPIVNWFVLELLWRPTMILHYDRGQGVPIDGAVLRDMVESPLGVLLETSTLWSSALAAIAVAFAYVLAFLAARTIVWWFEGAHRSWFVNGGGKLADVFMLLALTGVLGAGLVYAIEVFASTLDQGIWLLAAAVEPIDPPGYQPGTYPTTGALVQIFWPILQLVVIYSAAWWLWRRIDFPRIEQRLGWVPSRTDSRLLYLTLAAWLAWPLSLLGGLVPMLR